MLASIAPWLTVTDGHRALSFYQSAFGAQEVYRHEGPDGSLIVRLAVGTAEFWVSGGAEGSSASTSDSAAGSSATGSVPLGGAFVDNSPLGGDSVRMILTVADPHLNHLY